MSDAVSRKDFVALVGTVAAAEVLPAASEAATAPAKAPPLKPLGSEPEAYKYFTAPEAAFVEAAVERLIPTDELGPGAKQAGVAYFIDQQLGGQFGLAAKMYRQGPWAQGAPTQGYQLPLTPREVYRLAIAETNAYCKKQYGKTFDKLSPVQQDAVLQALDDAKLTYDSVPGKVFFEMLYANTNQGFFSDPMYGGNRNKIGWKLIGHPGVPVAYNAYIGKHNVPYKVAEPVGIADVERSIGLGGGES
ncbi:MAG TPA: gluconate 2-dehydrogenase subunit 3 family protein [Candidatus Binatia bacterium]|nr:gluconate 2-dehydrogenase subunit 3 family protein [Candidatus Binatia bacterium]